MAQSPPPVVLSSDGETIAVFLPSSSVGLIRFALYSVATGQLQTTLQHRRQGDTEATPNTVVFCSAYLVAVFSQSWVVWDLTRGVVCHSVTSTDSESRWIDASATSGPTPTLYLMQQTKKKLQVHVFTLDSAGSVILNRKVKVGKAKVANFTVLEEKLVLRLPDQVRVVHSETGSKMAKVSGVPNDDLTLVSVGSRFVATLHSDQVIVIDCDSGKQVAACTTKTSSKVADSSLQVLESSDRGAQLLVNGRDCMDLQWSDDKVTLEALSMHIVHDDTVDRCVVRTHPMSRRLTALLQNRGQVQVHRLELAEDDVKIVWEKAVAETEVTKRKQTEATALGPAQAGQEARGIVDGPPSKKPRRESDEDETNDDDDEGPTVAERLRLLQQALNEEDLDDDDDDEEEVDEAKADAKETQGFSPKQATTESLEKLLRQALTAGDDSMLELALAVRDQAVLQQTCRQLPEDLANLLLAALTSRLALKPVRAEQLCVWVQTLLRTGKVRSPEYLQPLRNLLQERLEVFPALLKLEGRLGMIGAL